MYKAIAQREKLEIDRHTINIPIMGNKPNEGKTICQFNVILTKFLLLLLLRFRRMYLVYNLFFLVLLFLYYFLYYLYSQLQNYSYKYY